MPDLLIIVVLTVHLLAMNLASAGPLLCIWLARCPNPNPITDASDPLREGVGQTLAWLSVWAMMLGMLTGGLLYVSPSAGWTAALSRLPSRALWYAAAELAFSLICLLIYAGRWRALRRHRWWHALLAVASSSNLLYHFPPLMSVLGKLAANPIWASAETLDRTRLLPLMMRGEVLALSTHFVLASVAVAAIAMLGLLSKFNEDRWREFALPLSRRAAWIALLSSVLQVPAGIWLLASLPHSARRAMMGSNAMVSLAFIGALLLTFMLLQRLLTIAVGSVRPSDLRPVSWLLVILVLLMAATLHGSRKKNVPANKKTAAKHSVSRLLHSTAAGSANLTLPKISKRASRYLFA